ncbi:MAG: hypothetical protein ACI9MC_001520, partial [Kiritimatiellia bacterium]
EQMMMSAPGEIEDKPTRAPLAVPGGKDDLPSRVDGEDAPAAPSGNRSGGGNRSSD